LISAISSFRREARRRLSAFLRSLLDDTVLLVLDLDLDLARGTGADAAVDTDAVVLLVLADLVEDVLDVVIVDLRSSSKGELVRTRRRPGDLARPVLVAFLVDGGMGNGAGFDFLGGEPVVALFAATSFSLFGFQLPSDEVLHLGPRDDALKLEKVAYEFYCPQRPSRNSNSTKQQRL